MKRDGYWTSPKAATKGWWYANQGSIDVCTGSTCVTIRRHKLVEYIKRTAPKAKRSARKRGDQ